MFSFWHRWAERRRLAILDADRLTEEFGDAAYEVAWSMAQDVESGQFIDSRPEGHWRRVGNILAKRSYRPFWRSSNDAAG